jgi:hypothetical protein
MGSSANGRDSGADATAARDERAGEGAWADELAARFERYDPAPGDEQPIDEYLRGRTQRAGRDLPAGS